MRASLPIPWLALGCVLAGGWVFGPQPLEGQKLPPSQGRLRFGVGYVANAPEMMAGGGVFAIFPHLGGIGVYFDAKFDLGSPSDDLAFRKDLTPAQLDDDTSYDFIQDEFTWRSFNVALIRPLRPSLMVYGGAGYAESTAYRWYENVEFEIGRAVLVKAPGEGGGHLNLMVGVMLKLTSIVHTQIGIETQPRGMTVGASIEIPNR